MKYPSAVDAWLAAILVGVPLALLVTGIALLFLLPAGAGGAFILSALGVGGLITALAWPCEYLLSEQGLRIRCGLLVEDIPLHRIRGAEKSGSLWSAPALSIRRVRVVLDHGSRVISPRDRDGFIRDLQARLGTAGQGLDRG